MSGGTRAGPSGSFSHQRVLRASDLSSTVFLTAQPAGHEPGQYLVSGVIVVRVAPSGQNLERRVTFNAPNGAGPQDIPSNFSPYGVTSGPGTYASDPQTIQSDGSAPIVVSFVPNGLPDLTTLVDFYVAATLQTSSG